jgi:hypothetical protein
MKNKNMRDLEKYWAEQQKKAAKPAKPTKAVPQKKSREDVNQAASGVVTEATERSE